MEQKIREIVSSIEIKITPFGIETNGEKAVEKLLEVFCQNHYHSAKELCSELLKNERKGVEANRCNSLKEEYHIDNCIALENIIRLIDKNIIELQQS